MCMWYIHAQPAWFYKISYRSYFSSDCKLVQNILPDIVYTFWLLHGIMQYSNAAEQLRQGAEPAVLSFHSTAEKDIDHLHSRSQRL